MLDIFFMVFFVLSISVIFYLLHFSEGKVNKISVVNVTVFSMCAFSIAGTFPLFYQLDSYFVSNGVTDPKQVFEVLMLSSISIFIFLVAIILTRRVLEWEPIQLVSSDIEGLSFRSYLFLLGVFLFSLIILFLYLSKVNSIAIFVAFKDGAAAAGLSRSDMGNAFSGKYHWYTLVMHDFINLITFSIFSAWLLKRNLILLLLFIVCFMVSSFTAVMAIEKAPFVSLLMALFMVYYLTMHNGIVPKKSIIILGLFVFLVLVLFFKVFMGYESLLSAIWSIFSRMFAGSIEPAYYYLDFFPKENDFLYGKSFPNPAGVFPYTPFELTLEIRNWKHPNEVIVGSYPTIFWGEAYANFGYIGVPIISFIVGVVVSLIDYFLSKLILNPVTVGFIVWVIFHIKELSVTGFSGYFVDFYLLGVSLVVLIVFYLQGKGFFIKNNGMQSN